MNGNGARICDVEEGDRSWVRPFFSTTRWNDIQCAADVADPQFDASWERLAKAYWLPLYAFLRRRGHGADEAGELIQAFFARLIQRDILGRADAARGRFRSLLLAALTSFVTDRWKYNHRQCRQPAQPFLPLDAADAEAYYRAEGVASDTPERAYDRGWACALLALTLARLEKEYVVRGRGELFARLRAYLEDDGAATHAQTALELGCTKGAVSSELYRLRQRFRELLRAEVARTLTDPAQVEVELDSLLEALQS